MSPEQCSGDVVEKQSDLFSASAVLYELLTLRKAFSGDSPAAIIHQVVSHRPDPPMNISKEVPKDLNDAIMRGLEKKPSDRFASCREMAMAIAVSSEIKTVEDASPTIALDLDKTVESADAHAIPLLSPFRRKRYNVSKAVLIRAAILLALVSAFWIGLNLLPVSEMPQSPVLTAPLKSPIPNNTGTANFLIDPSGAEVFVDGNLKGISPLVISLPAGSHEIRILKSGYDTLEATIDLPTGGSVPIELKLEKQEDPQ